MASTPYFIGSFSEGVQRNIEPFMLPDTAFPDLEDAFLFRGRIRRRYGNKFLGRLVQSVTVVSALHPVAGNITFTDTLVNLPISPGSVVVTLLDTGAATVYTFVDNGLGILSAGAGTSGTIDYLTGVFVINFPALPVPVGAYNVSTFYEYFTGRPVMGLPTQETTAINAENLIAFDTVKANLWIDVLNRFVDISYDTTGTAITWTGSNSQFFWGTNYYNNAAGNKLFWATNFVRADRIRYYDGTAAVPGVSGGWTVFRPQTKAAANWFLDTALIVLSYKDRLIALNTLELENNVPTARPNRARWSQNGDPTVVATSWLDDTPGRGGYIDAPTSEQIVSARFAKDILVVFFERSTWQLTYTGNEVLPFVWNRVNSELGCESTFSAVPFDRGIFAVGDKGIITSDSINVERIDQKIPDEVFEFHNGSNGPIRVHGIRDYYKQFVYWTFPNLDKNSVFPNRMLVLNYLEGSYSFFNDSYTCFGNYQPTTDLIWSKALFPWAGSTSTWSASLTQAEFPYIVAGNQQGFVMVMNYMEKIANEISLYITNASQANPCVITSPNHNLSVGQYITISGVNGMVQLNGNVYQVLDVLSVNTFSLKNPATGLAVDSIAFAAYTRSGFITVRNNINIVTKRFNPFFPTGEKAVLSQFDIYVERTTSGQISCDYLVDESDSDPVLTAIIPTSKEYGPAIPMQKYWQRVYGQVQGQFIQLQFYLNTDEMVNTTIQESDIVIHALILWFAKSGRLVSFDRII